MLIGESPLTLWWQVQKKKRSAKFFHDLHILRYFFLKVFPTNSWRVKSSSTVKGLMLPLLHNTLRLLIYAVSNYYNRLMFCCGMLTLGSTCLRQPLYSKILKLWQMATCFWVNFGISFVLSSCTIMFIEKHCVQLGDRRRPLLHYCAHMQTEAESICFPLELLMSLQFPSLTDALDVYVRRVVPDRTFAY